MSTNNNATTKCFLITPLTDGLDQANLSEFGTIEALSDRGPHIWSPDQGIDETVSALHDADFDPAQDFVVMTGSTIHVAFLVLAVTQFILGSEDFRNDKAWSALIFNARDRCYQPISIPVTRVFERAL